MAMLQAGSGKREALLNTVAISEGNVETGARRIPLLGRAFYGFAALAFVALCIKLAAIWFGGMISAGGHTDSTIEREIVIGNDVLRVPENLIRFGQARRDGIQQRLDLYLRWPELEGYSREARDDFNHAGGAKRILFLSFEPKVLSRDMSARLEPIYSHVIEREAADGPAGLLLYRFSEKSGYVNEQLAVGYGQGTGPFVTRCLEGEMARQSLAACERDVHIGDDLSLTYRFPLELLPEWRTLDPAIIRKARTLLRTDG